MDCAHDLNVPSGRAMTTGFIPRPALSNLACNESEESKLITDSIPIATH
jgi:hypothetical protein